jgi:hypothetical protein
MANKTTSPRRLAANRANARRSTGPTTSAGKAKSALNAVKTGLTGRTVLLPQEDVALYQAHVQRFQEELQPVGALETALVQSLADTQWRLNRIPSLESGLLALGRRRCAPDLFADEPDPAVRAVLLEAHVFNTEAPALKNLYLQESRLRRQYTRDLRELDKLRAERAEKEQKQEAERRWEEEKRSVLQCGCEDCLNLARRLWPELVEKREDVDTVASNLQTKRKSVKSLLNGRPEAH